MQSNVPFLCCFTQEGLLSALTEACWEPSAVIVSLAALCEKSSPFNWNEFRKDSLLSSLDKQICCDAQLHSWGQLEKASI
ncbi:hypothetical protein VTN00DRAFT_8637 [Thermoascus crustaceus]|uniref:uncharacterized protein n=1 Tax=Thermoascus crustaceus TaxID=5088 RepID=UPI003744108D